MSVEIFTYSLVFPKFSIDFDVNLKLSIEWTRGFSSHGPDFVFAVAETWLSIQGSRYLIESAIRPGNLIEEFKDFSVKLSSPPYVQNLEHIIPRGGWCAWMRGYWNRLNNDCSTVDDEANYDMLIGFSLMDSREGHIAIYRYRGTPTLEVATRTEEGIEPIHVWSEFDPEKAVTEVHELQQSILVKILQASRT